MSRLSSSSSVDAGGLLEDAAEALHLSLDAGQGAKLLGFLQLLRRWNKVYNLTAVDVPEQALIQHLFDCLAAVPALRREGDRRGGWKQVLDVGSGAGLPGIVFAVMEPDLQVTCIDSVGKKAAFVRQAAALLKLNNVRSEKVRAEAIKSHAFDLICCRAFGSLATFIKRTAPALSNTGVWLAMKGQNPSREISDVSSHVDVFHVEQLEVPKLAAKRCLVWMRSVGVK